MLCLASFFLLFCIAWVVIPNIGRNSKDDTTNQHDSIEEAIPPQYTKNPNDKISYDVSRIRIAAESSAGVGDVYSCMIEYEDYIIFDNEIGRTYDVNYKVIGGIGVTHLEFDGNVARPVYGPIEDWWYNVTLSDGTTGFIWGGTEGMYVDELSSNDKGGVTTDTTNNSHQNQTNFVDSNNQESTYTPANPDEPESADTPIKPENFGAETSQPTQVYTCLDPSCNNTIKISGTYCSEHKCANSSCSFSRSYNSQYCIVCNCNKSGCKNAVISGGIYCSEHTCVANGCTFEKSIGSSYCFSHKCMSCNNERVAGSFYCIDHT